MGWRGPVATVLIVLGCVLAPISVIAVWSANQVSDPSRYVASVSPLISQPAVRSALGMIELIGRSPARPRPAGLAPPGGSGG